MDNRIRRNEVCIIGQPRCDYVFSSSRTCFIGYGFNTSQLEVDLLKTILIEEGIDPVEAGSSLATGRNVFCTKICSKIITSQFCAIFVNNDETLNGEQPNANVNMEYGLMLGFNKCIIPFQRANQSLPFNVAGLDTIKYTTTDFKAKATEAVKDAVALTSPGVDVPMFEQMMQMFCIANDVLVCRVDNEGENLLYSRGQPLGYYLLCDFSGWNYIYFGVYHQLTAPAIVWRLLRTKDILNGIVTSADLRVKLGFGTEEQKRMAEEAIGRVSVWLVVSDPEVKAELDNWVSRERYPYGLRIFLESDVRQQFDDIASGKVFLA